MNRIFIALAAAIILLLTSAVPQNPENLEVDHIASSFELTTPRGLTSLQNLRGRNIILCFWSKDNPASRMANRIYDKMYRNREDVEYFGICTDAGESNLCHAINETDGNDPAHQLYLDEMAASGLTAYIPADSESGAYLIDKYSILRQIASASEIIRI